MPKLKVRNATNTAWVEVTGLTGSKIVETHNHQNDDEGGILSAENALVWPAGDNGNVWTLSGGTPQWAALPSQWVWFQVMFSIEGNLSVTGNPLRIYAPCALTIDKVFIAVATAPVGAAVIVDINKNGTTIFTTQSNRPQIAAGSNTGESGTPDITSLAAGDYLTMDVDQVGSSTPGADLTVHVRCKQYVSSA